MSHVKRSLIRLLCLLMIAAAVTGRPGKSKRGSTRHSRDQRVVGGDPVTGDTYQFIVSLRVLPKELHRCGGFLVTRRHVVTTASCIYSLRGKELHAYMNPLRLDNVGTFIRVAQMQTHPNFTVTPHENDIAVLTLEKSYNAQPPTIPEWTEMPPKAEVLTFGWGYDRVKGGLGNFTMHFFKLNVVPNGLCSLVLREYLGCEVLCGTASEPFATSPADVGTPLIYKNDNKFYAVGMLVKETEDMVNAAPYLRLHRYRDWVGNLTKNGTDDTTTTTVAVTTTTTTTTTPTEAVTEETTTTAAPTTVTEAPETTTTVADEDSSIEEYQEQPIKERSKKRKAMKRQVRRDSSGKRHLSRHG